MRVRAMAGTARAALRATGRRHRTVLAVLGGALAVLPAVAVSQSAAHWALLASTERTGTLALQGGYDPHPAQLAVDGGLPGLDGGLPQGMSPQALPAYELPSGPLGIPVSALKAYKNAAAILAKEQPGCHIDWALIASIGRIESNHARGGFLDAKGNTREPILGPVLNGEGPFAAIPDTDGGRFDGDPVWDRAVGPTQFIPATWLGYASDGNGDGEANPNNIYDATLGTGRYLCSGGLDLAVPDQLRAAIYRYNNSDTYVNTVLVWAQAYRTGVAPSPDSTVPIGAPNAPIPASGGTPTPPPGTSVAGSPATTTTGPRPTGSSPRPTGSSPGSQISGTTKTTTTSKPPTTTTPTCASSSSSAPSTAPSPTLPPCASSGTPTPTPGGSSSAG